MDAPSPELRAEWLAEHPGQRADVPEDHDSHGDWIIGARIVVAFAGLSLAGLLLAVREVVS